MDNNYKYPKIRLLQAENGIMSDKFFYGNRAGLLDWDNIRYKQLYDIFKILQGNYWIAREITMTNDFSQWDKVVDAGYDKAFLRSIGLLQTLDSNQSTFVYGLSRVTSDLSGEALILNTSFMEVVHNEAYTYILGTLTGKNTHQKSLNDTLWDELIQKRNRVVFDAYEDFLNNLDTQDPVRLAKALIGNAILEGINFTTAFAFFYSLHHHTGLMGGTVNQIQYINRDESQHAFLFALFFRILATENPDINTEEFSEYAHNVMKEAVDLEIQWANYLLSDLDFIDMIDYEDYIKYIANKRMVQLGFSPIYEGLEDESDNPFPWIAAYEKPNLLRGDFFEETLLYTNNSVDSAIDDY